MGAEDVDDAVAGEATEHGGGGWARLRWGGGLGSGGGELGAWVEVGGRGWGRGFVGVGNGAEGEGLDSGFGGEARVGRGDGGLALGGGVALHAGAVRVRTAFHTAIVRFRTAFHAAVHGLVGEAVGVLVFVTEGVGDLEGSRRAMRILASPQRGLRSGELTLYLPWICLTMSSESEMTRREWWPWSRAYWREARRPEYSA